MTFAKTEHLYGLGMGVDAYYLAKRAQDQKNQGKGMLCVILPDMYRLKQLLADLQFFQYTHALNITVFPDWELLPYDPFSPSVDIISTRLATLHQLQKPKKTGKAGKLDESIDILLLPISTMVQRLPPASYVAAHTFMLKVGDALPHATWLAHMQQAGYEPVKNVQSMGEYAVRGSILDVFPLGETLPYRIELLYDNIASIAVFNTETQRSLFEVQSLQLLPKREYAFDDAARTRFAEGFVQQFKKLPTAMLHALKHGVPFHGIHHYLPLFFAETALMFDYLPKDTNCVFMDGIGQSLTHFWQELRARHHFFQHDLDHPALPPQQLYMTEEDFFKNAKNFHRLDVHSHITDGKKHAIENTNIPTFLQADGQVDGTMWQNFLHKYADFDVCLSATSLGRCDTLWQQMALLGTPFTADFSTQDKINHLTFHQEPEKTKQRTLALVHGSLRQGFIALKEKKIFLTEDAFTAHYARKKQKNRHAADDYTLSIEDIQAQDALVHVQHGVGRYQGLIAMDIDGTTQEFVHLQYAQHADLYVPIDQLHLLSRYAGEHPPLHALGHKDWQKAKQKALQSVKDTAAELLELYAQRSLAQAPHMDLPMQDYETFSKDFGFEETLDQASAIQAVIQDMSQGKPMDRLVCGDVGFGKTEVAMRAAFICMMNGKQVAMLTPTTLLAEQHYHNFQNRFSRWPVKIAELSRFTSVKTAQKVVNEIADGQVDMIIGTHKLLQPDVKFANLGLVIVDEEHRFGVRQKELLKNLRKEVHILTMTATPIPRTLGMAMDGVRDLSIISTPPQKRLSVKTWVGQHQSALIREAVMREVRRGGQVYFLHNHVQSIEQRREQLQALLPEVSIEVLHGQMPGKVLEQVMRDFTHQRFQVLLCSTIIETGIDVPNANTMIIEAANRFGLAQLHQLRGRVGRSHHQAYAYLLVDDWDNLAGDAKKRLEAIMDFQTLGSGFHLAMQDLEIRGSGEILSDKQSGNIQQVGLGLYGHMLQRTITLLKQQKKLVDDDVMHMQHSEIHLQTSCILPPTYIENVQTRIHFYQRMSQSQNLDDITDIQEDIINRFGMMPDAAKHLLYMHRLRIVADDLGVDKIHFNQKNILMVFGVHTKAQPAKLVQLLQQRKDVQMQGQQLRLAMGQDIALDVRYKTIWDVLHHLK